MLQELTNNGVSIDDLISLLDRHRKYVTEDHLVKLRFYVNSFSNTVETEESGNVDDLRSEIRRLVSYIKKSRQRLEERGSDVTSREVKDLIQSSSSLFSMLTKLDETITNQANLRKIESATVEAIKTLSIDQQNTFFSVLEEYLSE